ncbi:MAG: 2-amino-4-hydroxy-6-hydroxymethyldihydropteridine diphosphokinase [Flavobacteriales bacterium]|nr:2-amino-4-hydroxy-6-hydroxymethyldihydropteridine diphosphokinase [Flavobacteriales bacterium]
MDQSTLNQSYIQLGGNLGEVLETFSMVKSALRSQDIEILASSSIYVSESWGFQSKHEFLNQVLHVSTSLGPFELLTQTHNIERQLGRKRASDGYQDRTIDIDILFFNDDIIKDSALIIPHPKLHERLFVLKPLSELNKDLRHPIFEKTVSTMLNECKDNLAVKILDDIRQD